MKRMLVVIGCLLAFHLTLFAGNNPTPLQMLFSIKKVFPEVKEVSVFISKGQLASEQEKITRAAAQTQLKVVLYPIDNASDIGSSIRQIPEKSFLVIFDSAVMDQNSSRLYILSKCKERGISLVTSSSAYTESGALLGVLSGQDQKTDLVVNLTHNEQFQSKFNPDYVQQTGITRVIR